MFCVSGAVTTAVMVAVVWEVVVAEGWDAWGEAAEWEVEGDREATGKKTPKTWGGDMKATGKETPKKILIR